MEVVFSHETADRTPGSARFTDFLTRQLSSLQVSILQELQVELGSLHKSGEQPLEGACIDVGTTVVKWDISDVRSTSEDQLADGAWSALRELLEGQHTEEADEAEVQPLPPMPFSSEGREPQLHRKTSPLSTCAEEPENAQGTQADSHEGSGLAGRFVVVSWAAGPEPVQRVDAGGRRVSEDVARRQAAERARGSLALLDDHVSVSSEGRPSRELPTVTSEGQAEEEAVEESVNEAEAVAGKAMLIENVPSSVAFAGSIPNASMGAVRGIIATSKGAGNFREVQSVDQRPLWVRLRSQLCEWFIAFVVIVNTITLGVQLDFHRDSNVWILVDGVFAGIFFVEMCVKMYINGFLPYFLGKERRCRLRADSNLRWHLFEFLLVATATWEVKVATEAYFSGKDIDSRQMALLRILRLSRFPRLLRICRLQCFSDLMMMLSGAMGGMRTLGWSVVLLALSVHITAMFYRETLGHEEGEKEFASLQDTWITMFRCLILDECINEDGKPILYRAALRHGWFYGAFFIFAKIGMVFGLCNVITAIYVENTVAAAKYNHLHQKRQRLADAQMFADKTKELVEFIWEVFDDVQKLGPGDLRKHRVSLGSLGSVGIDEILHTVVITPEFFNQLRSLQEFQDLLDDLDVSEEDQLDLFDTLDVDGSGSVDLEELVVGICKLRGDARRSDVINVMLTARSIQMAIAKLETTVETMFATQTEMVRAMGIASTQCDQGPVASGRKSWVPSQFQSRPPGGGGSRDGAFGVSSHGARQRVSSMLRSSRQV